jgi:hypothetical protein
VIVAWAVAALLVAVVPFAFAKIAIIVFAAFAYMTFGTRRATLNRALFAGAVWLALDIVVELATAAHIHHAWFALLGSPAHPAVRDALLVAWVAAPAFFAREGDRGTMRAWRM